MRSNTFLRRLGAALAMAFLLDLGGQASAMLCAAVGAATPHLPVAHAAGMGHATIAHSSLRQLDLARGGCRIPAGDTDCATMTTCAWPTAVVTSRLTALSFAHPSFESAEPALLRSGPATAPEPPPPRR
jgi:hypothetical protein